jgi:hypothetical protein
VRADVRSRSYKWLQKVSTWLYMFNGLALRSHQSHLSETHSAVPVPRHNPLYPVSCNTTLTSCQNPLPWTTDAPRLASAPRNKLCASSSVIVSPQIPDHFDGWRHPSGGGGANNAAVPLDDAVGAAAVAVANADEPDEADRGKNR